ncbi:hypothetical protein ACFYTQ_35460 [Nocardia sp. NPDC004068]|uniref:hypothetical protein n=1 Tax=Nocardia sp. NPDC004068 TaxID=3364303 RepID=UPI00367A4E50
MSLSNTFTTSNVGRRVKQIMFAISAASVLGVAAAGTAAATYTPDNTFTSEIACEHAGGMKVAAAGGPSQLQYRCIYVGNMPNGVMGCVNNASPASGCLGTWYFLQTWPTGGL